MNALYLFHLLLVGSFSSVAAFSATPTHSALSRAEIEKLLDVIPVYAVTEPEKGGIVLVNEKESSNGNEIAYFFFSPETANSVFSPLKQKKKNDDSSWDVTQFSLGLVWFELFQKQQKGIEYRLVPDSRELASARMVLGEESEEAATFNSAYNEIPIFVDQSLRLQGDDGGKKLPMYFSLQDLLESCQQAGKDYEPTISIANFCSMMEQMQVDSENDFRNVIMIPPTILDVGASSRIETDSNDDETFTTPMATDNWDD